MMRRVTTAAFAMFLLISLPGSLFAQSQEEWYIGKPINDITFTGLATVAAKDLQTIVKPYIGRNFSIDLFWEIQGKLFALDYFETIEGDAKPTDEAKTAVIVNFVVKERPSVSSIVLSGNREVRTPDIMDKIVIKKGDLVSQAKVKTDETAIRALYLDKGYTEATVTGTITTDEKDNTAVVTFEISEGSQTTVKEVRFSGNAFASESSLRNLMKTKPPFLFDTGVFQESKLEEDKKAIIDYYTDHGYIDSKIERVDRQVQSQQGKNQLVLTVYVNEGDQWTFGGLNLSGNSVFITARLSDLIYQKPQKVLSLQKLQKDIQRITDLYYENGYIFNSFDLKEARDDAKKTITYTLNIVERDKAHIENIIFKGNTRTKEFVLRRELPFEEGDIFNRTKIIEGLRNLYYLQFFSSIQPETPIGSAEGLMNIVFNLEEQSTADIQFGVIFSGQDFPISGNVKWNEKNFMGTGQTIGIDLEASPIKQTVALSYLEPWMFGARWSAGISLSFVHSTMQNVLQDILPPFFTDDQSAIAAPDPFTNQADYLSMIQRGQTIPKQYLMSYDSWDIGLGLNSGYRWQVPIFGYFGVRGGLSTRLRYLTYDPTLYRPYDVTVRNNLNTWNIIDQLSATVYLDGRDNPLSPTTGYQISQSFAYTGGVLFGSRHYNRTDSFVEGFLTLLNVPVAEDWSLMFVLAAHSGFSLLLPQFAYVAAPGTTNAIWQWTLPVTDSTDLLYIDGMTIGRGWSLMYGKALWDNKVELRMPISKELLWLTGFFDVVGLWQTPADLVNANINQFYFSYGFGLRFTLPQFPIRLYLGKKFQIQNGQVVYKAGLLGDPSSFWNFDFIISLGGDVF
jgi:outer membrane protein insertion porin family